jgi:hypothetical protein
MKVILLRRSTERKNAGKSNSGFGGAFGYFVSGEIDGISDGIVVRTPLSQMISKPL